MLKIILKNKKNIIIIYFKVKGILKNNSAKLTNRFLLSIDHFNVRTLRRPCENMAATCNCFYNEILISMSE